MGKVGRFQVMAVLQAARAQALGLSPDEAKSWGLNRAIFYAIAKRGFHRTRTAARGEHDGDRAAPSREAPAGRRYGDESFTLGHEKAYAAHDAGGGLRFRIGDDTQTPEEFNSQIASRFADWGGAWAEALDIIEHADRSDLESRSRFFDVLYKPRRDILAKSWSAQGQPPAAALSRRLAHRAAPVKSR